MFTQEKSKQDNGIQYNLDAETNSIYENLIDNLIHRELALRLNVVVKPER